MLRDITVLRFTNGEIDSDLETVLQQIKEKVIEIIENRKT
jgi:very-short-patch-repair endonuclease